MSTIVQYLLLLIKLDGMDVCVGTEPLQEESIVILPTHALQINAGFPDQAVIEVRSKTSPVTSIDVLKDMNYLSGVTELPLLYEVHG